jgi:hypothetical protein
VIGIFFGGIFTDALSGAIAVLIGVTSLFGGAAHYAAVLAGRTKREIERATAYGFFFGFGLGAIVLAIDSVA